MCGRLSRAAVLSGLALAAPALAAGLIAASSDSPLATAAAPAHAGPVGPGLENQIYAPERARPGNEGVAASDALGPIPNMVVAGQAFATRAVGPVLEPLFGSPPARA